MAGPLSGIRVFDLTRVLAGPSCTQMLGDLGAEVTKIERPGAGDDTRGFAPPFIRDERGDDTSESSYFCCTNRNKQSITLDLTAAKGQEIARQMIAESDVFVENFKTGGLAKYGLDYASLKEEFPGLVYCSITGFGHTGPYAPRPGYDVLIQAMSGFMSLTGEPDGTPQKAGLPVADLMAGMYAAVAINAALLHKQKTGQGQHIDIGMLDVMTAFSTIQGINYLATGEIPARLGNAHPNIVPYQAFKTADGDIILAVGNDSQFRKFCDFAGCSHLVDDERFDTNRKRVLNRNAFLPIFTAIIAAKPSDYWLEGMRELGISCGPINNLKQVFDDPHVQARGMKLEMDHPAIDGGKINLIASPMRFSETAVDYRRPPPMLGQHTDDILRDRLGLTPEQIDGLRAEGIL
jgi:crotonobetainyl-CoA:carnitine CoA-transferase CaiB-like acyl-CoA transferase